MTLREPCWVPIREAKADGRPTEVGVKRGKLMTLTIQLSEAVERQLTDRAMKAGKSVENVARELIEQGMAPQKSLDEILAPFRAEFAQSGMTESEWDAMIEEAREEVWQATNGKQP